MDDPHAGDPGWKPVVIPTRRRRSWWEKLLLRPPQFVDVVYFVPVDTPGSASAEDVARAGVGFAVEEPVIILDDKPRDEAQAAPADDAEPVDLRDVPAGHEPDERL